MEIVSVKNNTFLADELFSLFKSEWSEFEHFKLKKLDLKIPDPLVTLINGELVGGLSYTSFKKPISEDAAVWINAVFVISKYRRNGIASKLIEKAHGVVAELYALTDVPELYTKLGWKTVLKDIHGTTVKST